MPAPRAHAVRVTRHAVVRAPRATRPIAGSRLPRRLRNAANSRIASAAQPRDPAYTRIATDACPRVPGYTRHAPFARPRNTPQSGIATM
jgi:hypothetical protein